jgi:hypothetical protein
LSIAQSSSKPVLVTSDPVNARLPSARAHALQSIKQLLGICRDEQRLDMCSLYRSPLALHMCGSRRLARALIHERAQELIDQLAAYRLRSPRELSQRWTRITNFHEFPLYQPAWLAITADATGAPELAQAALDHVLQWYRPEAGAVVSADRLGQAPSISLVESAIAVMACQALGRGEIAARIGATLVAAVPEMLERHGIFSFRLRNDEKRDPIRPSCAANAHLYRIVPGEPRQFYWVLGLVIWSVADLRRTLSGAIDRAAFEGLLRSVLGFFDKSHEDVRTYAPWKLSAALALASTLDIADGLKARAAIEARALTQNILDMQRADGSWNWPDAEVVVPDLHLLPEPPQVTIDITAENLIWLAQVEAVLDGRHIPRLGQPEAAEAYIPVPLEAVDGRVIRI